jgi:hypothetical protein
MKVHRVGFIILIILFYFVVLFVVFVREISDGFICSAGLRRRSTAARLLRSWVRIPPGGMVVLCCVLSGRGLCDELITRPESSYRLWRVVVCDQEISWKRRP